VLAVCSVEVCLELCPSFFNGWLFITPTTGAHKVPCDKDLGVAHIYLLWMPGDDTTSLRKFGAVLYLLEKGIHRLLWVPCSTHLLQLVIQINCCDVPLSHEQVVQHFTSRDVCKNHHVIVESVQIHRLKNSDDHFFKRLLHSAEGAKGEDGFLPDMSSCAELRRCS
jgi:hypothetical protein